MSLLNDLLDLSKMEAGKMTYRMEENNIWQIIKNSKDEFATMIQEKELTLKMDFFETSINVTYDKYKISQVMSNLLSNAIRYSPENTAINIYFHSEPVKLGGCVQPGL